MRDFGRGIIVLISLLLLVTVGQTLLPFVFFLFAGAFAIIIVIIGYVVISGSLSQKRFQKRYKLFLERMNGACFFCYNSRRNSVEFAKNIVVPALNPKIHIVFVDGAEIKFGPDSDCISRMLYDERGRRGSKGFPYLLKIVDGQVLHLSVNNQFYNTVANGKPLLPLLAVINEFYASAPLASDS